MADARRITASEVDRRAGSSFEIVRGVSPKLAGSKTLLFGIFRFEPGSSVPPHTHTCETAIYVVAGRVALRVGDDLAERIEIGPGEFGYVGAGVVHDEETLGDVTAEVVFARDERGGETLPVDRDDPGWKALEG